MSNINAFRLIVEDLKKNNFDVEYINNNKNFIKMQYNNDKLNKSIPKYIILEPRSVYTDIDFLNSFIHALNKTDIVFVPEDDVLRIPFFAGLSHTDLMNFLFDSKCNNEITSDIDINVNFDILPSNFNMSGLNRFSKYLEFIHNKQPIYESNNNFIMYVEYFANLVIQLDWKIGRVLPLNLLNIYPNNNAFLKIFEEINNRNKEFNR